MRPPVRQQRNVIEWNADNPIGTPVRVRLDSGEIKLTVTLSAAWMLGASSQHPGHTAVIMVEGIFGAYALERVSVDLDRCPLYRHAEDYERRCTSGNCVCPFEADQNQCGERRE